MVFCPTFQEIILMFCNVYQICLVSYYLQLVKIFFSMDKSRTAPNYFVNVTIALCIISIICTQHKTVIQLITFITNRDHFQFCELESLQAACTSILDCPHELDEPKLSPSSVVAQSKFNHSFCGQPQANLAPKICYLVYFQTY